MFSRKLFTTFTILVLSLVISLNIMASKSHVRKEVIDLALKGAIEENMRADSVVIAGEKYQIEKSINKTLEKKIRKLLKKWKPMFGAVAVIDNSTGQVISSVGYYNKSKRIDDEIVFSATHPAASVIKIITAANLLDRGKVRYSTPFYFNGKSTTLYKDQLKEKRNKWSGRQSFSTAFSFSNNVIFAKAAIKYSSSNSLHKTAIKFGFETELMNYVNLDQSVLMNASSRFELAELASGFNKKTLISPVHAASIASVIANGGILKGPEFIKKIKKGKETIWEAKQEKTKRVIKEYTAKELRKMMRKVVKSGSGRKMFRKYPSRILRSLDYGGKTGSITGGDPHGKRDWFVGYAKPKSGKSPGISIAVMLVHGPNWTVRSTLIGKKVMEYYFQ